MSAPPNRDSSVAAAEIGADPPPSRPRFWPEVRWARWALVFLIAFAFLRGVLWGMTFPSFFGPDEDYHFLYAEYVTTQHALPDPDKYLYPREYPQLAIAMNYDAYGLGQPAFKGDPKASVRKLDRAPESWREPFERGRGVGVVHPPLYHAFAAGVNASLGEASVFTRYNAVKWLTAAFGALAVWGAWLLAAQVFRQEPLRLLTGFLVAAQPMVSLLSGIVNHDALLIALFTIALAFMMFVLRTPPNRRQGAWLGGAVALTLLVKGTALALLPLAGLAFLGQALAYRAAWREAARSAAVALGVVALLAGWWYVRSLVVYGSLTGATGTDAAGAPVEATLGDYWNWVKEWTGFTYRTYWFHHFFYEAPRGSVLFYVPGYVGLLGMLGLGTYAFRARRELLSPRRPRLRQAVLLTIGALALYLPLLWVDIQHRLDGAGFSMQGGRYLLPGYAGVVVLLIMGLRELVRPRAQPVVFTGLAMLAAWFMWKTYSTNYLYRYYGNADTPWGELFRHMSFDRPEFITPATIRILIGLMVASLAAAVVALVGGTRPPRSGEHAGEAGARRRLPLRRRVPATSR